MVALQQRLEAQEGEMQGLRAQLQQQRDDQYQQAPPQEVPPAQLVPQPVANLNAQAIIRQDLFERFCRMRAPEFEGSFDPSVADEWLSSLQVILDFINVTDQEKVRCVSFVLKKDAHYW